MNKITKIWVLWVALCSLLVALHTSADTTTTWAAQKLKLQLTAGNESCTMVDYDFGSFDVKATDQSTSEKTWLVTCTFLKKPHLVVTFQLWDLSNGDGSTISGSNFTWSFVGVSVNWSLHQPSDINNQPFTITAYDKPAKEVWELTGNLKISWIIPGWTPEWTYTWELNLMIQR